MIDILRSMVCGDTIITAKIMIDIHRERKKDSRGEDLV
jgi:hypothetical protein